MKVLVLLASLVSMTAFAALSSNSYLPPNNLHLEDLQERAASNVSENQFNEIIDSIMDIYSPIASARGVRLTVAKLWSDSTVNANASQPSDDVWHINMYGGLARRPEVTPDGFAMVVCHELGHHFAGYPFYGAQDWAASEGIADAFATQVCARKLWAADPENREFRKSVNGYAKRQCDSRWTAQQNRDLCYRTSEAGLSLASLLSKLKRLTSRKWHVRWFRTPLGSAASTPTLQVLCAANGGMTLLSQDAAW